MSETITGFAGWTPYPGNGSSGGLNTGTQPDPRPIPFSYLGVQDGVAELDANGLVPIWELPGTLPASIMPPQIATLGGVFSRVAQTSKFITSINTDGSVTLVQPATSDIAGFSGGVTSLAVPLTGGTMSGFLTLAGNPTTALQAVTKQYVDNSSGLTINVRLNGATGNGTTDDTAALQACCATVVAAGGGTVYMPAGKYLISANLQIASNCSIIGDGNSTHIIIITGFVNPGPAFPPGGGGYNAISNVNWGASVQTDKNMSVENVFIDCSNNPTFGAWSGVEFRMTDNVIVSNCTFLYGGDAVRFRASNAGRVYGCYSTNVTDCSWDYFEGATNACVIGCYSSTNGTNQPCAINSVLTNVSTGFIVDGVVVSGCTFIDTVGRPIQIEPLGNSNTNVVKNVTFTNNILKNVSVVFRGAVNGITVTGNVFSEFTTGGNCITCYTFFGGGVPTAVVVANNTFINTHCTTGFGVIRVESPNCIIAGNYIDGMGPSDGPCIYLGTASTGSILSGNSLSNGKIQGLQPVAQSNALYLPNGVHWGTYDNLGFTVDMTVQVADNNLIWNGTSSTGTIRVIATMIQHADTSAFILYPPVELGAGFANYILANGATATNSPAFSAQGSDTNVALRVLGKGTSGVLLGVFSGAGPPTTSNIATGQKCTWTDTSAGTTKDYANVGGVIKATAAYT